MTILIADSGSTKTDWRFIDENGEILSFRSEGYNPYLISGRQLEESLEREVFTQMGNRIPKELFFYGAGCGAVEKKAVVKNALAGIFPDTTIEVNHDLLGAARALCGKEKGMAAILGTGSNSCCYDGKEIFENRPSLGYVLGDEGSGVGLGKELLRKFLYGDLDSQLKENLMKRFDLSREGILENIYSKPFPNRYIASFAKFIFQNIENQQCAEMVIDNFRSFFKHHVLRYTHAHDWPLHVTGSVGFYFSNLLRRVAEEQNVRLGRVIETPISGLVNFHMDN